MNQRRFPFKFDSLKQYSSKTNTSHAMNSERREFSMTRVYQDGQWSQTPSILGDAKTTDELYKIVGKLGFLAPMEMTCRTGRLEVYTHHASDPQQFSFLCLLYISQFCYSILVTDLASLLKLLSEIDAHPKEQVTVTTTSSQKAGQTVNYTKSTKRVNGADQ